MAEPVKTCPDCGAPIPVGAPAGLCVACMLSMAEVGRNPAANDSTHAVAPPLRMVGDYELLREIGRGGMGVVYEARHKKLGRVVALKLLLAGEYASEAAVARFVEEARVISSLDHPNIVPIYEVGEHEGRHFYTMKLIAGESLAKKFEVQAREVQSPSLDARASALLLQKVVRAVQFVHQRGIIHRDLSPENVLIDTSGEPWITDFGLSRLLDDGRRLTRSYTIVGKPDYMSPEQADPRGQTLTTATDLFSLGAIFYELLTGQRPFAAETPLATLERVRNENPRAPSSLNAAVDRDLDTICLKCLAKEPADRYESAAALADDLERWLHGEPILARPVGPLERSWKWMRRHPLKTALSGASILAVAGPLVISFYYYNILLPDQARSHPTVGRDHNINGYAIGFETRHPDRATLNFDTPAFRNQTQRCLIYFTNIPPESVTWFANLRCQVMADTIGVPNEPRSKVVLPGEPFMIDKRKRRDRAYYVAPIGGWRGEDVLARAPAAHLYVILLDFDEKKEWK